jgi:putative hydrolase
MKLASRAQVMGRGDPLYEDMHVHSTFSDGQNSVLENLEAASRAGLRRILCVDHVRKSSDWLPSFVGEVNRLRPQFPDLEILVGVEAKMLNAAGELDLPDDRSGIDYIHAADHQVPLHTQGFSPRVIAEQLALGTLTSEFVIQSILAAMHGCIRTYSTLIFSHPFSVLPKLGLNEAQVSESDLLHLGSAASKSGALFELSEAWRCPSERVVKCLLQAGAGFVVSTDSHASAKIGRYQNYCVPLLQRLKHGLVHEA